MALLSAGETQPGLGPLTPPVGALRSDPAMVSHGRRLGLRARATVATALATLLISTLLAFVTFALVRNYLLAQREKVTQREAFANARVVRDVLAGQEPDVGKVLAELQTEPGSTVFLHRNQQWFASAVGLSDDTISPELREAVLNGEAGWARFSVDGKAQLGVAVPLPSINAAYIEVFPMESLNRTLEVLGNALAGGLVASAVGGVSGFLGVALGAFGAHALKDRLSAEMLAILNERLQNDPQTELRVAAEEQRKITRLRLEKLLNQ